MLVFKMDTTGLFRYGQRHELRILFPRDNKSRLSPSPKLGNGLARHLLGRSNSHYIRSSHSPNHLGSPNGGITSKGSGGSLLSKDVILSPCSNADHDIKKGGASPAPSSIDHSLTNGSTTSSSPSSLHESNGHPIPPVRRRRKNSTVSLKTRRRQHLDHSVFKGGAGDDSGQGYVSIRIKPDEGGKYGFNVKGGADQQQPVLVSRVAPGTPADRCFPRLNEGDQVLLINGSDVSTMTHCEVVSAIRTSQEMQSNGLVLTVKQNVYEPEGLEEPAFQYVPESLPDGVSRGGLSGRGGALDESMLLLTEALDSGSLVAQFEQLYRRKPGLVVNEARRQENEKKNRYRDISPYDGTRVILKTASSGDYINASHVKMEIPGSGVVNRYIASQGPLSTTSGDFWHMVWEQQSTLVVMLTTVVEQGRIKCHRYWPRLYESVDYGWMKITCNKEQETPGFAFREFTLTNTQTEEDRHVTHMQYLAWPDHGVPDDSTDFLNFVAKVREGRTGMVEPTIVHCSAGIGRTGVLILMETAQCLIEANEPVYPLDIVREMRDQRAMMIQTASQYRFVCEAIQRVYNESLVQPLPEYQQR